MILATPAQVGAGAPELSLPLDCDLGQTCFIQAYVDRDSTDGIRDFACGTLANDGHRGTDFRVTHDKQIYGIGINVLAAAPGTVVALRDGMVDIPQIGADAPDITGRECGNGVVLDHGAGWRTQYCHMRKGSVPVTKGQKVARGEPIGQIGFSGLTQFPHVHLKVTHNGKTIDPFRPSTGKSCEVEPQDQLWATPISYTPGGVMSAGFANKAISFEEVRTGPADLRETPPTSAALVVWGYFFGLQKDDVVRLKLLRPDGSVMTDKTIIAEKKLAQAYWMAGKRRGETRWPSGVYCGSVSLTRQGTDLGSRTITTTVK